MFSGNLYKYESLTGEDLNYKPTTDEQARLYYFTLNKFFNKKLQKETNKKVCRKDYKIFKIKTKTEDIKEVTNFVDKPLILEANTNYKKLK